MKVSRYVEQSEDIYLENPPKIEIREVSFKYPDTTNWSMRNINLSIEPGEVVAIVGPSGSGKTTLVDLIFGILEPNSGAVLIGGIKAKEVMAKNPGSMGYVPQISHLIRGTVYENVILGLSPESAPKNKVELALERANLLDFIEGLPGQLDQSIGDSGVQLSGGQKQRLGLARALISDPGVLVLDEATSALDAESEFSISKMLEGLVGKATLIIIAHRLATIRKVPKIIYMDQGQIIAIGNFEEIRRLVPDFDNQARIMGL